MIPFKSAPTILLKAEEWKIEEKKRGFSPGIN
jgi:hypothetical protein